MRNEFLLFIIILLQHPKQSKTSVIWSSTELGQEGTTRSQQRVGMRGGGLKAGATNEVRLTDSKLRAVIVLLAKPFLSLVDFSFGSIL